MTSGPSLRWLYVGMLCFGAAGCRHKSAPVVVPSAAQAPAPLEQTPEPDDPLLVKMIPLQQAPLPSVAIKLKKVKKPRKKAPVVLPPVLIASAGAVPETSVIGALTQGGETAPGRQQQATELIASLEKRLTSVAPEVKDKQKQGLERATNFWREAKKALDSGDTDAAITLATKSKLLLDDLLK